jgi:hypothetical protein
MEDVSRRTSFSTVMVMIPISRGAKVPSITVLMMRRVAWTVKDVNCHGAAAEELLLIG